MESAHKRDLAAETIARRSLADQARELLNRLEARGLTLIVAESCTAGLLAELLSDAPGAAERFHGSFVTYTKEHKVRALGVPADLLRAKGAVCIEVARAMAEGALRHSAADLAAAITGVAGPEPDPDGNPVGRVCVAVARRGAAPVTFERDYGATGRDAVRQRVVGEALQALIEAAQDTGADNADVAGGTCHAGQASADRR